MNQCALHSGACGLLYFLGLSATAAPLEGVVVVERGPHHRVIRNVQTVQVGDGSVERNRDIVELESGMHRWSGQGWVEASPRLQIVNGKAVADLLYSVEFTPNLATPGAVSVTLPDGNRLVMHVLGLAYVDGLNSVMIAQVRDCAGEIAGPDQNELTFTDAFTDFPIDCKFIVRKGSLSQHIRIRSALPPPTDYGLSEQAFLEVFTEVVESPAGTIEPRRWRAAQGNQAEIMDEKISFGPMEFVTGKAFFSDQGALEGEVPVSKAWSVLEGRTFLRERIPFAEIKAEIDKLPPVAAVGPRRRAKTLLAADFLPRLLEARAAVKPIQVASTKTSDPAAYVVDYEAVFSADIFTWKADATHYIAGAVTIKTNIFEGTVIKLAPTNGARLTITGPVTNYASQFRPVTFTARDDHTIGEAIGSAAVSGYYGTKALELDWYTAGAIFNLEHFRFRYAQVGVHFNGGLGNVLSHAQFVNCSNAIEHTSSDVSLRNALIHKANVAFAGNSGSTNRGEHLTVHEVIDLHNSGNPTILLTNSLLVALTNAGTYTGLSNQTASAVGSGFQAVGSGYHYLTNNSVWRDAGTANINANLLTYLGQSTTFPPSTAFTNTVISSDTFFTPQAARDTAVPDLGYHFPPLDYALDGSYVSNCVLTITNGVSIGTFGLTALLLRKNAELIAKGLATDLIHFSQTVAVQEQPVAWGAQGGSHAFINSDWTGGIAPKVQLRFAALDVPGGSLTYHIYGDDNANKGYTNISIRDCQFSGGNIQFLDVNPAKCAFTNNVFERVQMLIVDPFELIFANNNFRGVGGLIWQANSNALWRFKDNLVDSSSFGYATACLREYNAFYQSPDCYLDQNTNTTEKVLTNLVYETGRFGRWYQPTNSPLINAGSTNNAASVGFYWYATTTNHAIEANSHLDIGYHSIGLDSTTGEPWDTNDDGIPNYVQDVTGNGITEPNELTGLKLWLKADAGVTAPSDLVNAWADQSGNNNDATQVTGDKHPLIVSSALNGKPVVRFDGTNDELILPDFTQTFSTGEIISVLKADSEAPAAHRGLWRFGLQSGRYPDTNGLIWESFGVAITARVVGRPSLSITNYHTYNVLSAPGEWSARFNDILHLHTTNNSVSFSNDTNVLGRSLSTAAEFFKGDLAEVVMFNRALSTLDRDELSAYLHQRYALIVSVPASPSGVRAIAVSSNQVSLSWTNTLSSTAVRFIIERQTASGSYTHIATVRNGTSLVDSGLTASTTYSYRLKARNAAGDSGYSDPVSTITSNSTASMPLADLRLWLKADAGLAGASLGFWEDQSGYFHHALQTNLSARPEIVSSVLHGKPLIRFDGQDDFLKLPESWLASFSQAEAFAVVKAAVDTPSVLRTLWRFGTVDSGYPTDEGMVKEDFGSTILRETSASGISLDKYHLYSVSAKSNEWANRFNGVTLLQANTNTVSFTSEPLLARASSLSSQFFHGDIAELHLYNRVLSTDERESVIFYLNDKYGLRDTDGDGLSDKDEMSQGTNPNVTDSNGDGLSDWESVQAGINATSDDIDGDGILNFQEIINGTSPFEADTDRDGFSDAADLFPLDPTRSSLPSLDPSDTTAPTINLQEPAHATPL